MWYWNVVYLFVGALIGFFIAALCAIARCNDGETIQRTEKGDSK